MSINHLNADNNFIIISNTCLFASCASEFSEIFQFLLAGLEDLKVFLTCSFDFFITYHIVSMCKEAT